MYLRLWVGEHTILHQIYLIALSKDPHISTRKFSSVGVSSSRFMAAIPPFQRNRSDYLNIV